MRRYFPIFFALLLVTFLIPECVLGAVTGKIMGTVKDAETGQPLYPANITVEGTGMGAASRRDGEFFIINVSPGTYEVRAEMMGYRDVVTENVEVRADFTTTVDFTLGQTTVTVLEPITVRAERPLIQPDVTSSTRFISAQDMEYLPTRGYQEAAFLQTGVVSFAVQPDFDITDSESSNQPLLNIRGGRYNEVAYFVDGFSQQDPLTGFSSTALSQSAISDITVLTGGFNAEYGKVMSGAVNVITKEGGDKYHGAADLVTDNLSGSWNNAHAYDFNIYDFSLGGPGLVLPVLTDDASFFFSTERRWGGDRAPKATADGPLPNNSISGWSWQGKLTWNPTSQLKFKLGGLGSKDEWEEYMNTYSFNIDHAPRYKDFNYSFTANMSHMLNSQSFYMVGLNYFTTDRKRGDGAYFDDLAAYSRPAGNPRFDQYLNLFWNIDDPETPVKVDRQGTVMSGDEAHVWDDYMHRNANYWGFRFDYTNQVTPQHELKFGADYEYHTVKLYRHVLPVQVKLVDSTVTSYKDDFDSPFQDDKYDTIWYYSDPNSWVQDADYYGYYWTPVDSTLYTPAHWRVIETYDEDNNLVDVDSVWANDYYRYNYAEREIDSGLQGKKHPKTASVYFQDKFTYEGIVVNAGLRYDYLNVNTPALRNEDYPLGDDGTSLDPEDLTDNEIHHVFSPRIGIGFPISPRTLFHANYGKFFQQPNLEDIYVSYDYMEYMIRWSPYYSPFGNPNLRPEKTTAYEMGIAQQIGYNAKLDIVAYYKDVENLVQVQNITSQPNAFASYRNVDYGTIRGIDFGFHLARSNYTSVNLAYSLSWARGTGSVSNSQYNIAWTGDEIPKQTTPLSFDQRHKMSLNLDVRFPQQDGPKWGKYWPLSNAGFNILLNIGSGQPYTPTYTWNEVTLAAVSVTPSGGINSRYGPWTYRFDWKINKGFYFGSTFVDLYVWALNVFDSQNAAYVYQSTGAPNTTGWLRTAEGEKWLRDNGSRGSDLYSSAQENPNNYGVPRMVRFGIKTTF
jgi:outer membrane receptor protein involved in Fe transport